MACRGGLQKVVGTPGFLVISLGFSYSRITYCLIRVKVKEPSFLALAPQTLLVSSSESSNTSLFLCLTTGLVRFVFQIPNLSCLYGDWGQGQGLVMVLQLYLESYLLVLRACSSLYSKYLIILYFSLSCVLRSNSSLSSFSLSGNGRVSEETLWFTVTLRVSISASIFSFYCLRIRLETSILLTFSFISKIVFCNQLWGERIAAFWLISNCARANQLDTVAASSLNIVLSVQQCCLSLNISSSKMFLISTFSPCKEVILSCRYSPLKTSLVDLERSPDPTKKSSHV